MSYIYFFLKILEYWNRTYVTLIIRLSFLSDISIFYVYSIISKSEMKTKLNIKFLHKMFLQCMECMHLISFFLMELLCSTFFTNKYLKLYGLGNFYLFKINKKKPNLTRYIYKIRLKEICIFFWHYWIKETEHNWFKLKISILDNFETSSTHSFPQSRT